MDVSQEEDRVDGRQVIIIFAIAITLAFAGAVWAGFLLAGRESELRPGRSFPERSLPAPSEASAIEQTVFGNDVPAARARAAEKRLPAEAIERGIDLYLRRHGGGR